MCITLDEGKIQLNFAEAALLIQGSTCIYSKKVKCKKWAFGWPPVRRQSKLDKEMKPPARDSTVSGAITLQVELLHNLVFQTLDYIRDRKHK